MENYKTQEEVIESFWDAHPTFSNYRNKPWTQNKFPADVRMAFVFYVDMLQKDGQITAELADEITLDNR